MAMEDPTPVQSESIDQILRGGRHLLDLINEVLDISRIEAGRLLISPEPVLVSEVVQEAMDMVKPLADERRIQFRQELECRRFVQADRQRIKQVFLNLLTNAVKYNREGGTVKVCCKVEESGFLLIDFCDTGLGIAPDDIRRLFTAFERLGANQSTIEGTGLGLTLSRGLVEAMGGKLDAQSQVGEGTTLTVRLPLAEGQVERLERTNGKEINGVPVKLADNTRTVLYIEDNLSNLRLIERILGRQPEIRLHSALLGKLGIELAQLHRPDLILLDLHLPDINGDEVLKRLQADPNTRTIPVVMLTADASAGQIKRLLDAGAAEYLTKPLDVARFLQVLQKNLS